MWYSSHLKSCKWKSECSWAGGRGIVEKNMACSLPMLSYESRVFDKENPVNKDVYCQ